MKKSRNFLHLEAYRRTFLSYLLIVLLFSGSILGFLYRDIYKTARENFANEAVKVYDDMDRKAGELVKSIDQFSARLYSNSATADDFLRFFGSTAEQYTTLRLDLPERPGTSILSEFKSLVIQSNFSIRHIIFYARENIVDLEFNNQGDSRHRIISSLEAGNICRSGCVYQKDIHKDSAYLGKVAVVIDVTKFIEKNLMTDPGRSLCVVLPGKIIPVGALSLTIPQARQVVEAGGFPKRFSDGDLSLYCASFASQFLPCSLVYMVTAETLFSQLYFHFIVITLGFLLAFGAITLVLIRRFSRDSTYINTILHSMHLAEQENFEPIQVPGDSSEYDAIIRGLNKLYSHLESLIEQEYKLTISQQKAEMDMLSAQLSPHFLYNTLERIRMRAVLAKAPEVAEATAGLGLLYRNIVKTEPVIPLKKELEITEQYLELMTFLYGDQFMYYMDVDPELTSMQTPKIWMQPIVENFFKHNFRQDDQIKIIFIELNAVEGGFEGRFFDNIGKLEPERMAQINAQLQSGSDSGEGIGLMNVLHRLRLFYGSELNITMENNDPAGICIHIVFQKKGEEQCIDF